VLNCLRVTSKCLGMLCHNNKKDLNVFVPPSVKSMEGMDVATDSTPILYAGGKNSRKKINIEKKLRTHLKWEIGEHYQHTEKERG